MKFISFSERRIHCVRSSVCQMHFCYFIMTKQSWMILKLPFYWRRNQKRRVPLAFYHSELCAVLKLKMSLIENDYYNFPAFLFFTFQKTNSFNGSFIFNKHQGSTKNQTEGSNIFKIYISSEHINFREVWISILWRTKFGQKARRVYNSGCRRAGFLQRLHRTAGLVHWFNGTSDAQYC